jgi:hypothetical protein
MKVDLMSVEPFNYTFGPINIPFHVFLQNVDGWGPGDVEIKYNPDKLTLPEDIAEYKDKIIKQKEEDAKKNGKVFFDGPQVRMRNYGHRVVGDESVMKLYLEFGPGSYFTHACTGQILDEKILKDDAGNTVSIREKYIKNPRSWNDCLGNPVGIGSVLISEKDNALVYVKRSDKITQYPGRYGVAASGSMDGKKDLLDDLPNPFKTIQREITEEMGVETRLEDFKLTGVGRPWDDLHCELWGFTVVDKTVGQILGAPKKHKYESLTIESVDFEPKSVMKILKNPADSWVNAHVVATIDALLKHYKTDEVMSAAYELAK